MSTCLFCGNEIRLTDQGWTEDASYDHTTAEESAQMSLQCGIAPDSRHEPDEDGDKPFVPCHRGHTEPCLCEN